MIDEKEIEVNQNNGGNRISSPQEILNMAGENRPIDRSELGINTPKTVDGLQSFNEGFDFLQHGSDSSSNFNDGVGGVMEMIVSSIIFLLICTALIVGIVANVVKYPPASEKLYSIMMILLGIGGMGIFSMIIITYLKSL